MNVNLVKSLFSTGLLVVLLGSASITFAQEQQESPMPADPMNAEDPMGRASPEMREMARAMKSMADMCRTMMQREMASRPYWITAGAVLGALLVIALVLFVVLEVQWVRFWSLRIRTERKKLE